MELQIKLKKKKLYLEANKQWTKYHVKCLEVSK